MGWTVLGFEYGYFLESDLALTVWPCSTFAALSNFEPETLLNFGGKT